MAKHAARVLAQIENAANQGHFAHSAFPLANRFATCGYLGFDFDGTTTVSLFCGIIEWCSLFKNPPYSPLQIKHHELSSRFRCFEFPA